MARQLRHLVEAADRPTVTLQVVPLAVGGHTGLDGSFALLDFYRNDSIVYIDHKTCGLFIEEVGQVEHFRKEMDRLKAVALSPDRSVRLLAQIAKEYERE